MKVDKILKTTKYMNLANFPWLC